MKFFRQGKPNFWITLVIIIFISLFVLTSFLPVLAENNIGNESETIKKLKEVAGQVGFKTEDVDIGITIGKIIKIILSYLGIISVILIIVGGFYWMTSGGNEEKIKKAKSLIINAFIGLAIIVLSYVIVHFVIEKLQFITETTPTSP